MEKFIAVDNEIVNLANVVKIVLDKVNYNIVFVFLDGKLNTIKSFNNIQDTMTAYNQILSQLEATSI